MAGDPVIVNNQKLRTASELTQERRMLAASVFRLDGSGEGTMRGDLSLTGTSVSPKQPTSFVKKTTRPASASDFTAYVGAYAIQNDTPFPNAGKTVNPPACVTNTSATIAEPVPYVTGTTTAVRANTVPRSASDYIRERIACQQQQGQPHIATEVSAEPVFKDDTIRYPYLNKQYVSGATTCSPTTSYPPVVNRVDVAITPQANYQARPAKSKIPVYAVPSPEMPVATVTALPNCYTGENRTGKWANGNVVPKDALRYVEKHHGNDLSTMVSGRKPVPRRYQIPAGTPAHMKIDAPLGPRTPNM
jgi:hypothetical protein